MFIAGDVLAYIARGRTGILRSMVAKYDLVKAAGFLDENYYHYDGFILTLHLAKLTPFVYLPDPLMEKRDHAGGTSKGISFSERERCFQDVLAEVMRVMRSRPLAALIAPYLIVLAFGYRSWEGRLISVGYFWALMSVLAMRYSVVPSEQLILPHAKLRQISSNVTRIVIFCLGAGAVILAICAGFYFALYCRDVYDIVTSWHVKTITGRLTSVQYGALTWWCYKDVRVQTDGPLQDYQLFFYPTFIQTDSDYVMHILPPIYHHPVTGTMPVAMTV